MYAHDHDDHNKGSEGDRREIAPLSVALNDPGKRQHWQGNQGLDNNRGKEKPGRWRGR